MTNGVNPGSAWVELGVDLSNFNTGLSRAQQMTATFANVAQGTATSSLEKLQAAALTTANRFDRLSASIDGQKASVTVLEKTLAASQARLDQLKNAQKLDQDAIDRTSLSILKQQTTLDKLNRSLSLNQNALAQTESKLQAYDVAIQKAAANTQTIGTAAEKSAGGSDALGQALLQGIGIGSGYALVTQVISAGLGAITSGFESALSTVITFDSQLQQSQIGWTTLLGNGQAATKMLGDLQQVAAATPFTFDSLQSGARSLMAMGIAAKDVLPTMVDIGNVAAAFGVGDAGIEAITRAIGQMNAATRIHAQDMNQLTNVGIPAWQLLADATGKSVAEVRKLSEEGKITSDVFITAFREWSRANFGDAMQDQSHTFEGALSSLTDNLKIAGGQAFQPLFDAMTKWMNMTSTFVQSDTFKTWMLGLKIVTTIMTNEFENLGSKASNVLGIKLPDGATAGEAAVEKLKQQQIEATKATEDHTQAVNDLKDKLDAAKDKFDEYSQAQLAGTRAYEDALSDLQIAQTKANLALEEFQQIGGKLDQTLKPYQDAIDNQQKSVDDWQQKVDDASDAVRNQEQVVRDAEASLRPYDDAIRSAQDAADNQSDAVSRAEASLRNYDDAVKTTKTEIDYHRDQISDLKDQYDTLTDAIKAQQEALDGWRKVPLQGETALQNRIDQAELAVKQQQMRINQMKMGGAGKDALKVANDELDRRRLIADQLNLQMQTSYDEQHRQLENQGKVVNEVSYSQAQQNITNTQAWLDQLQSRVPGVQTQLDQQNAQLDDAENRLKAGEAARDKAADAVQTEKDKLDLLKGSIDAAKKAREEHNIAVQAEKDKLDDLKVTLDNVRNSYDEQKTKLGNLKDAYNDAKDNALKPYQDEVKKTGDAVKIWQDKHTIATGKMAQEIKDLTGRKKELTYDDQVAGLKLWGDQVDILTGKYNALLTAANLAGVSIPGISNGSANHDQVTGMGTYSAQAIDKMLKGTGLEGQGANIAAFSARYRVPAELAIAMFRKEAEFAKPGSLAAQDNNPGNIVDTGGAYGEDRPSGNRFGHYATMTEGVEAYFKLLDREYRRYLDRGDYAGLITKYAPPSQNNTAQYIQEITDWIMQIADAIMVAKGGAGATASGAINNGNPADDPRPDSTALQNVFGSSAHISSTYDDDRTGTTGVHQGLDVAMDVGSRVPSPVRIRITKVFPDQYSTGTTVMGVDDQGRQWLFAHLARVPLKAGDVVEAGGTLGYIGEQAHVHVQLRKQDDSSVPIDPSQAIDDAARPSGTGSAYNGQSYGTKSYSGKPVGGYDVYTSPKYGITDPVVPPYLSDGNPGRLALYKAFEDFRKYVSGTFLGDIVDSNADLDRSYRMLSGTYDDLMPKIPDLTSGVAAYTNAMNAAAAATNGASDAVDGLGQRFGSPGANPTYTDWWSAVGTPQTVDWEGGMGPGGTAQGQDSTAGTNAGSQAGMGWGTGWQQSLYDISPDINKTTADTLQSITDDTFRPWLNGNKTVFDVGGRSLMTAMQTGMSGAAGGINDAVGTSMTNAIQSVGSAVDQINKLLDAITKSISIKVDVTTTTNGAPTVPGQQGGNGGDAGGDGDTGSRPPTNLNTYNNTFFVTAQDGTNFVDRMRRRGKHL